MGHSRRSRLFGHICRVPKSGDFDGNLLNCPAFSRPIQKHLVYCCCFTSSHFLHIFTCKRLIYSERRGGKNNFIQMPNFLSLYTEGVRGAHSNASRTLQPNPTSFRPNFCSLPNSNIIGPSHAISLGQHKPKIVLGVQF